MIRYSLTCGQGHGFDSWFRSAEAYDGLHAAGQVSCPVCGDAQVEKTLMAPAVRPARKAAVAEKPDLKAPASDVEKALAELRRQVEENSDYVGMNFVAEARAMHEGTAPERSIYGEARPDEAKKLLEDGIPVAPLPFLPGRKTN
jgi:hypothetical protein